MWFLGRHSNGIVIASAFVAPLQIVHSAGIGKSEREECILKLTYWEAAPNGGGRGG